MHSRVPYRSEPRPPAAHAAGSPLRATSQDAHGRGVFGMRVERAEHRHLLIAQRPIDHIEVAHHVPHALRRGHKRVAEHPSCSTHRSATCAADLPCAAQ
eukprot:5466645-Prymnesium_polylepis.1